jgi:hypothetical protein
MAHMRKFSAGSDVKWCPVQGLKSNFQWVHLASQDFDTMCCGRVLMDQFCVMNIVN